MRTKQSRSAANNSKNRKQLEKALDAVFSQVVRQVGYCQWTGCKKTVNLQCSHIHSRAKKSVRWLRSNALCLCAGCHLFKWHQHPIEAAELARKILGQDEYERLYVLANQTKKWTVPELEALLIELKKELE